MILLDDWKTYEKDIEFRGSKKKEYGWYGWNPSSFKMLSNFVMLLLEKLQ